MFPAVFAGDYFKPLICSVLVCFSLFLFLHVFSFHDIFAGL